MNYASTLEKIEIIMGGAKPSTKAQYLAHIKSFLKFIKNKKNPDRLDIFRYIKYLRGKGYKESYLDFIVRRPLKKLWIDGFELSWPLKSHEEPRENEEDTTAPMLPNEDIIKLINWTRLFGENDKKVALALSTVYALRRHEITRVTKEDIDSKESTILIRTAKKGRVRRHLIPTEIFGLLATYDFPQVSETALSTMFGEICSKAEIKRPEKAGWHSIRRAVDTYLVDQGLNDAVIDGFLRWKTSGIMRRRYYIKDDKDIDELIFKSHHPFLRYWK